ncbi:MAG TPA: hypothetical protein VNH41_03820 [Steroidobacteraceae bacterium]|nr:hypothetical protein [Steroidobacteraceae bacterium]
MLRRSWRDDFFVAMTCGLRLLYVFVVMEHRSRRLIHCNVTAHPSALWTRQQLREALGYETRYRYLIHDRDNIFSLELDATELSTALSDGERHLRADDRHDPPRVSGLAHPAFRGASAPHPEIVDRPLQSRSPSHGARTWRAGPAGCRIEINAEVSP